MEHIRHFANKFKDFTTDSFTTHSPITKWVSSVIIVELKCQLEDLMLTLSFGGINRHNDHDYIRFNNEKPKSHSVCMPGVSNMGYFDKELSITFKYSNLCSHSAFKITRSYIGRFNSCANNHT